MSGSAGLFNKQKFFFYLVGSPKVGGAGDGKHKKKYGHPNMCNPNMLNKGIFKYQMYIQHQTNVEYL